MKATITNNGITVELSGSAQDIARVVSDLTTTPSSTPSTSSSTPTPSPSTLDEAVELAKSLGYTEASIKDFSSANKLARKLPRFVTHLGSGENFVAWYRHIDNTEARCFNYNTTNLKDVSLHRYFDLATTLEQQGH